MQRKKWTKKQYLRQDQHIDLVRFLFIMQQLDQILVSVKVLLK